MNKVAAIILNYNMPERTDALAEYILETVKVPFELIVVDNGSDNQEKAISSTLCLGKNVQVSNGFNMGLAYADAISAWEQFDFFAYWFLITSLEPPYGDVDILEMLLEPMINDSKVAFVVPALTPTTNTAWEHQKTKGGSGTRETWGTDFYLGGLVRAEWFNKVGRFNPKLRFGWGVCSEVNWHARKEGMKILLRDDVIIHKENNIGYTMDRMNMTAEERGRLSADEMVRVLTEKWGPNALEKLGHEFRK